MRYVGVIIIILFFLIECVSSDKTYVNNDTARSITTAYITAFFQAQSDGDASAGAYLETSTPAEIVTVKHTL